MIEIYGTIVILSQRSCILRLPKDNPRFALEIRLKASLARANILILVSGTGTCISSRIHFRFRPFQPRPTSSPNKARYILRLKYVTTSTTTSQVSMADSTANMSTPPPAPSSDSRPRKRVSQACQPCGLKKIKVQTAPVPH